MRNNALKICYLKIINSDFLEFEIRNSKFEMMEDFPSGKSFLTVQKSQLAFYSPFLNIELPTLICVAPSSMAISKSPDIPIERMSAP